MAQYVSGSVELNTVPPVTLPPAINFNLTGFQIFELAGALKAGPYFQASIEKGAAFTAPGGAVFIEPLSFPAGAANGKRSFPASGLLAYGSAVGPLVAGAGASCPT